VSYSADSWSRWLLSVARRAPAEQTLTGPKLDLALGADPLELRGPGEVPDLSGCLEYLPGGVRAVVWSDALGRAVSLTVYGEDSHLLIERAVTRLVQWPIRAALAARPSGGSRTASFVGVRSGSAPTPARAAGVSQGKVHPLEPR